MKRLAAIGALCALVVVGCDAEAQQDGPVGVIDDEPTDVKQLPDGFPNIVTLCMNGDRLYTTTRDYNSLVVVEGGCNE